MTAGGIVPVESPKKCELERISVAKLLSINVIFEAGHLVFWMLF